MSKKFASPSKKLNLLKIHYLAILEMKIPIVIIFSVIYFFCDVRCNILLAKEQTNQKIYSNEFKSLNVITGKN